jgi:hypothetical protein
MKTGHGEAVFVESEIVRVDVFTGCDIRCRATDRLGVFDNGFALADCAHCNLVPLVDLAGGRGAARQDIPHLDRHSGDGDIVFRRQQNAGWLAHPISLPCDRIWSGSAAFVFYRQ